ncbi:uncharacterized protein LOC134274907 isoform X3 [Saccostrea cucullata]|uniref:uncharacterized protein LOC134274907 isoform X3 n=1 Tax=Saccostrea cuccullata TaxID=36930 RepID=UPI002ED29B10
MYISLLRRMDAKVITAGYFFQGYLPEKSEACVIDTFPLTNRSRPLCATLCTRNLLCNSFDLCSGDGQPTCRLRYGQTRTLPNSTLSCIHFEIVSDFVCPGGFFWRSKGVCMNNNLALHKPVFMSSVYDDPLYAYQRLGNGSLAVNGEVRPDDTECSCTHLETKPWLTIDILDFFFVRRVVFVNRKTSEWRLHDLNVTVGTDNITFPCFCGFFQGPGTSHQEINMTCAETCRGRYVRLQITSPSPEHLQLCEVEVFSDCNV